MIHFHALSSCSNVHAAVVSKMQQLEMGHLSHEGMEKKLLSLITELTIQIANYCVSTMTQGERKNCATRRCDK